MGDIERKSLRWPLDRLLGCPKEKKKKGQGVKDAGHCYTTVFRGRGWDLKRCDRHVCLKGKVRQKRALSLENK